MIAYVGGGIFGFLMILAFTLLIVRGRKSKEWPLVFVATLCDVTTRSGRVLDSFTLVAFSQDEAQRVTLELLKMSGIYKENSDVRDLVSFIELGGETAGHEFDVLPEALRRVCLEVRRFEK